MTGHDAATVEAWTCPRHDPDNYEPCVTVEVEAA